MPSYRQLVHQWDAQLQQHQIPLETARVFLLELTRQQDVDLYLNYEQPASESIIQAFEAGMARIVKQEPLAYVLGYSWFYGYPIQVNEDVLIPRPETEELVAQILARTDELFADSSFIEAADIGTGSGAIALALAKEEPKMRMVATDISEKAIAVAQTNARALAVPVRFLVGDMAQPLIEQRLKLDLVVCNPPYIPDQEVLEASVAEYEPHVALFGGEDGLKFYRQVFAAAPLILKDKALMAFEIGWNQNEALLQEVAAAFPEAQAEVVRDINGKDRMLFVTFSGGQQE